ncbi:MAG: hypothetical protein AB1629_00440 [Candidatus Omnitrophota bacterium]
MLQLIKTLNEFTKGRNPLVLFYLLSFFWHISLFSILYITFPNGKNSLKSRDITFLGSFLNRYDIDSSLIKDRLSAKNEGFLRAAKEVILSKELPTQRKIDFFLDKPRHYVFSQEVIRKEDNLPLLEFLSKFEEKTIVDKKDSNFFDENQLRPKFLQFKEGLPCSTRFNLDISERGRVEFLDKEITSGNFEVDLFVQRAIRRLVFDTSRVGKRHNQKIEIDFKNDSN